MLFSSRVLHGQAICSDDIDNHIACDSIACFVPSFINENRPWTSH